MFHPIPADGFEWSARPWGGVLACAPLAEAADHFFTARNLALREDASAWHQVADAIGVRPDDLLLVRQIHGATVALATPGRQGWTVPEADAIATDDPSTAVAIQTADCVPILLAEDTGRAVAAVHAGWRGLARRAPVAGVDALLHHFGVRPERLIAAIGPAIGACCYEVGPEVRQAFASAGHDRDLLDRWFEPRPGGRFHLDTVAAARGQLEGAGIPPPRIHAAGLCTQTHADVFHSYRADGPRAGRMAAVIRPRVKGQR